MIKISNWMFWCFIVLNLLKDLIKKNSLKFYKLPSIQIPENRLASKFLYKMSSNVNGFCSIVCVFAINIYPINNYCYCLSFLLSSFKLLRDFFNATARRINEATTQITNNEIAMPFQFREFVLEPASSFFKHITQWITKTIKIVRYIIFISLQYSFKLEKIFIFFIEITSNPLLMYLIIKRFAFISV